MIRSASRGFAWTGFEIRLPGGSLRPEPDFRLGQQEGRHHDQQGDDNNQRGDCKNDDQGGQHGLECSGSDALQPVQKGRHHGRCVQQAAHPAALAERTGRNQQSRGATLEAWLADGSLLITTRFGETAQVHRVLAPGAARTQLTFFPEPVTSAQPSPSGNNAKGPCGVNRS